ncbi:MAG: hypothetical protein HY873_11495 [Chloroflexi bacterium]|nr:hypothetical protein [Chloroflexota bacterium]
MTRGGAQRPAGSRYVTPGWQPYAQPFNLTGQPAASVLCGFDSKGPPVGLNVAGRAYEDSLVLRACRAHEELAPRARREPAMA